MSEVELSDAELIESVRRTLMNGAAAVQRGFTRPDEDWDTVFMVAGTHGGADLQHPPYTSAPEKDRWVERELPRWVAERDGRVLGYFVSAWEGASENSPAAGEQLAQHSDRAERLVIAVVARESAELWWARIERGSAAPPSLGGWEQLPPDAIDSMVEELRRALAGKR